jgi:phosphoribosylformylglycinamidine synthase
MDQELKVQQGVLKMIKSNLIESAHDVSEGGLFVALFESAMPVELGFDITTDCEIRNDAFLFGEAQGRIVVSVDSEKESDFIDMKNDLKIPCTLLGHVTKGEMRINDESFGFVKECKKAYDNALGDFMKS